MQNLNCSLAIFLSFPMFSHRWRSLQVVGCNCGLFSVRSQRLCVCACVCVCVRRGSFTMLWTSHHPPPVHSCGSEPCHLPWHNGALWPQRADWHKGPCMLYTAAQCYCYYTLLKAKTYSTICHFQVSNDYRKTGFIKTYKECALWLKVEHHNKTQEYKKEFLVLKHSICKQVI